MSDSDHFAVRLEEADFAAVFERAETDAVRFARHRVPDRDVRNMDRHFLSDDAARLVLHRIRPRMLLDLIDAGDEHVVRADCPRDIAPLSLVPARDDEDIVALLDLTHDQSTSGASDTIFMNRSVRNSRVTGPKIRVPIGSSLGVSRTAALVSNLTLAPSLRRTPCRVRTTTA